MNTSHKRQERYLISIEEKELDTQFHTHTHTHKRNVEKPDSSTSCNIMRAMVKTLVVYVIPTDIYRGCVLCMCAQNYIYTVHIQDDLKFT